MNWQNWQKTDFSSVFRIKSEDWPKTWAKTQDDIIFLLPIIWYFWADCVAQATTRNILSLSAGTRKNWSSATIVWKGLGGEYSFSTEYSCLFCQILVDCMYRSLFLYSVPLVYVFDFMPIPCCFGYYSFVVSLKSGSVMLPALFFLKIALAIWGPL